MSDDLDALLTDDLDDAPDDGDAGNSAPPAGAAAPDPKLQKRINDLTSKWQAAEAKANALEAEKKAAGPGGVTPTAPKPAEQSAEAQAWFELAKENAIDAIYASDPRFKAYGIEKAQLAGRTPAEVQANADKLRKVIAGVESKVRNATLKEHGFAPELGGETRGTPKDYATMSTEEFEKVVAGATSY